jgi:hypothetical protein
MHAENLNWTEVTGGINTRRLQLAQEILDKLTPAEQGRARLEECADERTGIRYGQAMRRRGRCGKVGRSTYSYQVWLVWA